VTVDSPGHFVRPASRTVSVPVDAMGCNFVASNIRKTGSPDGPGSVEPGSLLTYTLALVAPSDGPVSVYDPLPAKATLVDDSLRAPSGVAYDAGARAITGTVSLAAGVSSTLSFAVQLPVTDTVGFAVSNRACIAEPGQELTSCQWSRYVHTYLQEYRVSLPLVHAKRP
jgi:hypothetical protein